MSTIKLSTAYQLVMTSLLLGALLGIVAQQLPLTFSAIVPSVRAMVIEESPIVAATAKSSWQNSMDTDRAVTAIVGHDAQTGLWLVCCQQNQLLWVSNQVVSALRSTVDNTFSEDGSNSYRGWAELANLGAGIPKEEQYFPAAVSEAAPVSKADYTLMQKRQYSEQVTPRIYLYVSKISSAGNEDGVANMALRVKKDGVELVNTARTHGGRPDLTWPIADERQQLANLKLEFPGIEAAGLWEIQLFDAHDVAVGPPVEVHFSSNERNREIYLHYTALSRELSRDEMSEQR